MTRSMAMDIGQSVRKGDQFTGCHRTEASKQTTRGPHERPSSTQWVKQLEVEIGGLKSKGGQVEDSWHAAYYQ